MSVLGRRILITLASVSSKIRMPTHLLKTPLRATCTPLRVQMRSDFIHPAYCELQTCRPLSPCETELAGPEKRPCFNKDNLVILRASTCNIKMIRSFLYNHYWPREPSVCALWMPICSNYLDAQTDKFASFGVRYIAFERLERTKELKMVGVLICNKLFPWAADEFEHWSLLTDSRPEQMHMLFKAFIIRGANLFKLYDVEYVYEMEVLATASEVMGLGVGTELVKLALFEAHDQRLPITAMFATSQYAAKICRSVGMKHDWSCNYTDLVDPKGRQLMWPRKPHLTVDVFTHKFVPS